MGVASKEIVVNCSPKDCYDAIVDFESYKEFSKELKKIKILKHSGNTWEVFFEVDLFKTVTYTNKLVGKPGKELKWTLIESNLLKTSNGSWVLKDLGDNQTHITYSVDIEIALPVPGMIAKMLVGSSLPAMLESFKKYAEKRAEKPTKKKK